MGPCAFTQTRMAASGRPDSGPAPRALRGGLAHEIGVSYAHSAQGQASAGLDADTGGTVMIEILLRFGYVALFVGTFLEGETILLIAAFLAHRGYFNIYWVTVVAALGTMFGDQLFYFIGRKHGMTFLDRRPRWKEKFQRAQQLIRHHELLIIFTFRFLYGLRNITPFALGISGTKPRLFVPLNIVAAIVWAVIFAGLGYLLGELAVTVLGKAHKYEFLIVAAIILLWASVWIVRFVKARRESGRRH